MGDDRRAQDDAGKRFSRGRVRIRGPIALWALLLASFLAVVTLYASFAEPLILKVYESEQIDRAQGRNASKAIREYEDYLRADPTSLRMRGRVVTALILARRYPAAIEHAAQALEYADESQRPIAQCIAARAHLAAGDIDAAENFAQHALEASPESGEAHFLLARIAAARGNFADMTEAYAQARELGPKKSSREYAEQWETHSRGLSAQARAIESEGDSGELLFGYGDTLERLGRIDEALEFFVQAAKFADAPPEAIYWSGVFAERENDRTGALNRYKQAAKSPQKHPNAAYALARLQASS